MPQGSRSVWSGLHAGTQVVAAAHKSLLLGGHVGQGHLRRCGEGPRELLSEHPARPRSVVQVHDEIGQTHLLESFEDGVDGGALLGDEEDLLAPGRKRGDQVGDGLALAGARRP